MVRGKSGVEADYMEPGRPYEDEERHVRPESVSVRDCVVRSECRKVGNEEQVEEEFEG